MANIQMYNFICNGWPKITLILNISNNCAHKSCRILSTVKLLCTDQINNSRTKLICVKFHFSEAKVKQ